MGDEMRKLSAALLAAFMLLLLSCQDSSNDTAVIFVSVANSYSFPYYLSATIPDQKAMRKQIEYLAEEAGNDYTEYAFTQVGNALTLDGVSYSAGGVLDFLQSLDLGSDDLLIFYYSGHGSAEDEEGKGATLYFDPTIANDQVYTDELIEALASSGGKKWLILDCCYSGAAVTGNSLYSSSVFSQVMLGTTLTYAWQGGDTADSIKDAFSASGSKTEGNDDIWVMAACSELQESFEDSHGFFTAGLLDALGYNLDEECASDPSYSRLTFYKVFNEASQNTIELLEEKAGSTYASCQTPESTLSPVDLILFEL